MDTGRKRQYVFGGIILAALVIFIVWTFSLLSQTSLKDISMSPGGDGMNWSYELISESGVKPVSPEIVDEFTVKFPGESCRAVRIKRTLNEELDGAQIGVYLYDVVCGVDILLDGEMLFSTLSGAPRDSEGFAVTDGLAPSASGMAEIFLPKDYLGRELELVSYFPSETTEIVPTFPYLCSVDTNFAITSVENVPPVSRATLCAIFAFLTVLVYVLDISNGKADKRILFLTVFYTMLFLDQSFSSLAGTYSLLTERLNMLDFTEELFIAPLLLFAAFSLTSWRRWVLAATTGAWFVYDLVCLIWSRMTFGPFYGKASAPIVLLLYILAAAMAAAEMKVKKLRPKKADVILYGSIAAAAAVVRAVIVSSEWDWDVPAYIYQTVGTSLEGYFYPLLMFVSYVCAIIATAAVIIEFVRRTLRTREALNSLAEQNRQAMESYKRMADSERATYSARHEMRHHMTVLSGMLQDGDADRAREYAASLTEEYNELPEGQYSKNTMVNIIAGSYLGRARARGIEVEYSFNLPETLSVADTDLCVFLTNMFENALNACEKTSGRKYINAKMHINGNYLFIGCKNSMSDGDTEAKRDNTHGYGLENMRRIAEKYGGILKIDKEDGDFSVKSGLNLGGTEG